MSMLRWGRVIRELQDAAALGAFGDQLRLYAQADGSLQLVESVPVVENGFAHTLVGNKLYPVLADFEGEPVTVGSGTSADDPPVFVELSEAQMTGPTVCYVTSTRGSAEEAWTVPGVFVVSLTMPEVESDAVTYLKVVALVRFGQVLTLEL